MSHRVIAFSRLSTEEQASEGRAGLRRQAEDIRVAAERYGLEIVRSVELVDVSGSDTLLAPEFQDMLADLASDEIDGVVCSAQDRLARPDTLGGLAAFDQFIKHRKKIWTPSGETDVASDSGFLLTGIQALMAGIEKRQIKMRTQAGKEEQRKRGRHANSKITLPRGVDFDFATGKWSWLEPEASRIRRAYRLLLSGRSVRSIAAEIGGYTSRGLAIALRNPIWTGRRVYTHKRGEKYAGKNGRQTDRKKVRRAQPLEVAIDIAPLIDQTAWSRAQEILGESAKSWNSARTLPSRFLVGGMAYCPCGQRLYTRGDRRPGKHDIYICSSRHPKGPGCGAHLIHRDTLDSRAERLVRDVVMRPKVLSRLVSAAMRPEAPQKEVDVQRATKELRKLEQQRDRLIRMTVTGLCSESAALREKKRIDDESAVWQQQLTTAAPDRLDATGLAETIAHLLAEFAFLQAEDQKRLLQAIVPRIVADPSGISEIAIRLPSTDVTHGTRTCTDSSPPPA